MIKHILINDETSCGKVLNQVLLSFEEETITLSQLIKKRIEEETEVNSNEKPNKQKSIFLKQSKRQDAYKALHAFREHGFFVLINNKHIKDLDAEIALHNTPSIRFVALHPLAV